MPGQAPGKLAEQEGLTPSEVAEHHDEPGAVFAQPGDDALQQVIVSGGVRGVVEQPVALGQVQLRRVDRIGGKPLGLARHQWLQVDEALVVDPAAQPHPATPGHRHHLLGGRPTGVHQLRPHRGISRGEVRVHVVHEVPEDLVSDVTVDHPDRPLLGTPARQGLGHSQVSLARGHRGAGIPGSGRLQDPVEEGAFRSGSPPPRRGAVGVLVLIYVRLVTGEGPVDVLQRVGLPARAVDADPGVIDPAALTGRVPATPAGHSGAPDGEQLILGGHLLRPGLGGDRGAAG